MVNLLITALFVVVFVLGYLLMKSKEDNKKLRYLNKSRTQIIKNMSMNLTENQLKKAYRLATGKAVNPRKGPTTRTIHRVIPVDKSSKYNMDDILNEINRVGMDKLSQGKKNFLKNYKKSE